MGPLILFSTYIFFLSSDLLFSILFANDTNVFIEGTHYDKLIDILNEELEKMYVIHRTRIKHKSRDVTMCGNSLTCTYNTTFLGVIIDDKLNWSDHILYIRNTISKSIGIILKNRSYLNNK